jgi:uncharacterized membrane protein YfcA
MDASPLPISELIPIAILGTMSGLLIGCIGIGGVILVPALVFIIGIQIKSAIAAAMMSYILSGLVATIVFARNKSIRWRMAGWLCAGAIPGALAGAWAVTAFDHLSLEGSLGALTMLSGLNSLRRHKVVELEEGRVSSAVLLAVGTVTSFLSSLTGTGGPLVLVPIMMCLSVPVLTAIGLSQAIQLPVAVAATAGNILYGRLDLVLGGILAAGLTVGSGCGAKLAHIVPRAILRRIVSIVLVLVGIFILANVGWRLVG